MQSFLNWGLKYGVIACVLIDLTACSTARKHQKDPENAPSAPPSASGQLPAPFGLPETPPVKLTPEEEKTAMNEAEKADDSTDDLDSEQTNSTDEPDDETDVAKTIEPAKHHVPFEFNQKVAEWIQYFSQKDRERFQRYLDRGEPYREVIENILEENNVPADIYYLGLIESGFDFHAKSRASAVGVWQFIRSTGKLYGLGVDAYIDERKDPIRATEAAAKHLRDLYHEFQSWYLAMAAYNAGPGRIRQAIRRAGGTHDFWELVEKKKLPRETMEYVPKFLAARYIGEHPDLFAFYINEEKKYPNVHLVEVPSPVTFERIEKDCSMPDGTLAFVNPQYLKDYTHPAKKVDEIWVPDQYQASVQKSYAQLETQRIHVVPARESRAARVPRVLVYRVRPGDTLRSIAKHRGLSVAYLKQVNGLKSSRVTAGERLKLSATSYQQRKAHPRKSRRRRKQ
jgi:membrane-bound lytic murein transglycosylase D